MGQVPYMQPHYLIIGRGRVAKHFSYYLNILQIPHSNWHRDLSEELLIEMSEKATHVLVLIQDGAIENFIQSHLFLGEKTLLHFSGALETPLAKSTHPLMAFASGYYSGSVYLKIPFVLIEGRGEFSDLLPGLPNPHYYISAEEKCRYHALCVMAGNFSTILWQKLFQEFEGRLNIPRQVAYPFMEQIYNNLLSMTGNQLTGPLVRGDFNTIMKNLESLKGDSFEQIYRAFVKSYNLEKYVEWNRFFQKSDLKHSDYEALS